MRTIRVKITDPVGVWFASTLLPTGRDEAKHIKALNDRAKSRNIPVEYDTATEEEYWEYRNNLRRNLNRG